MSVFDGLNLPKTIHQSSSEHNSDITVVQMGNTRRLRVDGLTQSVNCDAPSASRMYWGRAVQIIKENEPDLKSILILGLGGGTLAHLVAKEFPGVYIASVEIDKEIIKVATEYFDVDKIPNHHIFNADAMGVISMPEEYGFNPFSFDVLFVDIYCGEKFPDLGRSGTFLAGLDRLVKPAGLILFNRIYKEHHQDEVNFFIESVEHELYDVKSLIVAGRTNADNVIIFGRSNP